MSKNKNDYIQTIALVVVLFYLATSLLINTAKSCDVNIDYDVTVSGVNNNTVENKAEVQLACYKLCVEELGYSDNKLRMCLNKCEVITDKNKKEDQ